MLSKNLLIPLGFLLATATAVPSKRDDLSTTIESSATCFTKYQHAVETLDSLPTRTKTISHTVSSTVTACAGQSTITSTLTPDAVTVGNGLRARQAGCSTTTTMYVPSPLPTLLAIIGTGTAPASITSTTTAGLLNATTAGGICTETIASSTTTQHLKCAPTNLISQMNGYGIAKVGSNTANLMGLGDGTDASACCQTCVEATGCAAVEVDPDAGNCFMWSTENPTCGTGLQYSDAGQELDPGSGFLVQSGCGTIEAMDSL